MTKQEIDTYCEVENEILRDDFAGRAMQSMITLDSYRNWTMDQIAEGAYGMADRMIKERNKKIR